MLSTYYWIYRRDNSSQQRGHLNSFGLTNLLNVKNIILRKVMNNVLMKYQNMNLNTEYNFTKLNELLAHKVKLLKLACWNCQKCQTICINVYELTFHNPMETLYLPTVKIIIVTIEINLSYHSSILNFSNRFLEQIHC